MRGSRLLAPLLLPTMLAALACAPAAPPRTAAAAAAAGLPPSAERPGDREAIAAASRAFSDAYVRNDMPALGAVYTADAVLLPPGRELHGREAAMRWFAGGPNRRQLAHSMVPAELEIHGDVAIDRGTWHSTSQRGDEPPVTAAGAYLVVWLREPDGAWRIAYDMWHSPAAAAAPAAASAASGSAPRSAFVPMADGAEIHYLEAGPEGETEAAAGARRRPAIVFVPGFTMPAEIWEPQMRHFAPTHRVVAIDPRSQGRSTKTGDGSSSEVRADDLAGVLDRLELAPALLVCWSLAVDECVTLIERHGTDRLRGLVLVDGTPATPMEPEAAMARLRFLAAWQRDRAAQTERFVRSMFRTRQPDAYLAGLTRASLEVPTDSAVVLVLPSPADRWPVLATIDVPTLVVGTESPSLPDYRRMHEQIPGSRLEIFDGAGHALFVDQPERFNRLLEEFEAGLATAPAAP